MSYAGPAMTGDEASRFATSFLAERRLLPEGASV
jgi:hypothetical protein